MTPIKVKYSPRCVSSINTLSQMEVSADVESERRFLTCVCVGNGRFSLTRDISAAEAVRLTLVGLYKVFSCALI